MVNYEVTFIVDPVLSDDEIKTIAKKYEDAIAKVGKVVYINVMGARQLAYPINHKNTGIYYCIEFEITTGKPLIELELMMRRDEKLLRFLTVKLDKYGIKYNEDKRAGKIGTVKKKKKKEPVEDVRDKRKVNNNNRRPSPGTGSVSAPGTVKPKKDIIEEIEEELEEIASDPTV